MKGYKGCSRHTAENTKLITPEVTSKISLGVQDKAGQRLIEFCQKNAAVIANTLFQQHKRRLYTWTSPEVNTKMRFIIFFAAKDGEDQHSGVKQLSSK